MRTEPLKKVAGRTHPHCLGCAQLLAYLPPQATFCPNCGRRLRAAATVWRTAYAIASGIIRGVPEPAVAADRGPRPPVVVGYGNALWRLGWRYEHGRGMSRNVPEAIRCYGKSAALGNAEAQSRLAAPSMPIPVVSLPTETPAQVDVPAIDRGDDISVLESAVLESAMLDAEPSPG